MKQILSEEFRRMQKLAGIVEDKSNPLQGFEVPEGFDSEPIDDETHEIYEGEVLGYWSCPMEGWDEDHKDSVLIVKKEDGFYLDGYISFGNFEVEGPFSDIEEVKQKALEYMEELKEDWKDNDEY